LRLFRRIFEKQFKTENNADRNHDGQKQIFLLFVYHGFKSFGLSMGMRFTRYRVMRLLRLFGNGVISGFTPRMAPAEPFNGKPCSLDRSEPPIRFFGILRT
jgi:hypothetical protein